MLRVHEALATQTVSRLLGPNCPGLISPRNKSRIGIIPTAQCMSGSVGVISRSGTMIYEVVGATGRVGLGQSLILGLGGDMMPGTTMEEALELMIDHDDTEIIVLIGEIGGVSEFRAAEAIRQYYSGFEAGSSTGPKKPIVAIISGRTAPEGKTMGHAGALLSPGEQGAEAKARALQNAGAIVLPHLGVLDSTLRDEDFISR
ncbi:succinyl-CoA synthetase-like protein [Aspergillus pseudoustus]|uniref:Succinyl-CoA synthetase-like protein n=1 Tax=Aspergillus pseudoustus TaxID=1810923 RepID=A0ABR4KXP9_9EURO